MKRKLSERFGYMAGYFSISLLNDTISIYLLSYFTNILGISPAAAGTIFMAVRIWDAINDPFMGILADRTRSKWGSYRPYLLFGAVPAGIGFILCFTRPELKGSYMYIWALLVYLVMSMCLTLVSIPYGALPNTMTMDVRERSVLGAGRSIGSAVSGIVISILGTRLLQYFGSGALKSEGYTAMATVFAAAAAAGLIICFASVKERVFTSGKKINFKDGCASLKGNYGAFSLFIIAALFIMAISFRMSFNVYYFTYVIKNMNLMSFIMLVIYVSQFAALLCVPRLNARFGKRRMMQAGAVMTILSGLCFLGASGSKMLLFTAALLFGLSMSFSISIVWAALSDAADFGEWKTGIRAPAFLYTIAGFFIKCGGAAASWIIGLILEATCYDAFAAEQSEATIHGLYLANGLFPVILGISVFIVIFTYRQTDEKTKAVLSQLNMRRKNKHVF